MERAKIFRVLRIAWSVWWGILCVLLIGLWVRSYWRNDIVMSPRTMSISQVGTLNCLISENTMLPGWRWHSIILTKCDEPGNTKPTRWMWIVADKHVQLGFPYWLPVILSATVATLPWIRPTKRFSLRTLLIAITLIAVVLGVEVSMMR